MRPKAEAEKTRTCRIIFDATLMLDDVPTIIKRFSSSFKGPDNGIIIIMIICDD